MATLAGNPSPSNLRVPHARPTPSTLGGGDELPGTPLGSSSPNVPSSSCCAREVAEMRGSSAAQVSQEIMPENSVRINENTSTTWKMNIISGLMTWHRILRTNRQAALPSRRRLQQLRVLQDRGRQPPWHPLQIRGREELRKYASNHQVQPQTHNAKSLRLPQVMTNIWRHKHTSGVRSTCSLGARVRVSMQSEPKKALCTPKSKLGCTSRWITVA